MTPDSGLLVIAIVGIPVLVLVLLTGIAETVWPDAEPPRWLRRLMGQ